MAWARSLGHLGVTVEHCVGEDCEEVVETLLLSLLEGCLQTLCDHAMVVLVPHSRNNCLRAAGGCCQTTREARGGRAQG